MDPTKRKSRPLEDGIAGKRLGELYAEIAALATVNCGLTACFFGVVLLEVLQ